MIALYNEIKPSNCLYADTGHSKMTKRDTDRCQPIRYIILISLMEWISFKVVRLRVLCRILLLTHCPPNYTTVAYIDN